jgi:predicted O-methyltransferase YrrM
MNNLYQSIFNSLKQLEDYIFWKSRLENVFGYLEDIEGYALKLLAEKGPGNGEIIEIGSFMGKSTCWLAAGISQKHTTERVTAINHFTYPSKYERISSNG